MKILLANPRGFCAGVDRAIDIVERAVDKLGAPIYVRHEVVHNRHVVSSLKARGVVFVDELDEVPDGQTVIFSAHGVSQAVRDEAARRQLNVFDATCPLVTKVHMEVTRFSKQDIECVLIGHAGHPEVEGTLGQYHSTMAGIYLVETVDDVAKLQVKQADQLGFVTQTTLSMDDTQLIIEALRERFPHIHAPKRDDICYATQNRQDAVKALAQRSDLVLVIGSVNSSNSNRLCELARRYDIPAYLLDSKEQLSRAWFDGVDTVGITAGASAPEVLVQQVVAKLQEWGGSMAEEVSGVEETIVFALPKALRTPEVITDN